MKELSPALAPSLVPFQPGTVAVWRASALHVEYLPAITDGTGFLVVHRLRVSQEVLETARSAQGFVDQAPASEARGRRQELREVLKSARAQVLDPFSEFEERVIVAATREKN